MKCKYCQRDIPVYNQKEQVVKQLVIELPATGDRQLLVTVDVLGFCGFCHHTTLSAENYKLSNYAILEIIHKTKEKNNDG